jgi:hypothetical protein
MVRKGFWDGPLKKAAIVTVVSFSIALAALFGASWGTLFGRT